MRFSGPVALSSILISVLFSSCGNQGNPTAGGKHPRGTGPYDANGNYVEAWADNPSKWGKPRSSPVYSDDTPMIAANEQPPDDAIPLSSGGATFVNNTTRSSREVNVTTRTRESAATAGRNADRRVASAPKPKPAVRATADTRKAPASKAIASNTKKPKPTERSAGKSKSKTQAPTRYVIKKGDSLSKIAARHKTTVTALQRANGIKGTLIHPGKTLVIPRY
jgi:LysM repeat protein